MEDFIQVLRQAYAEALVEAGENYRASEGKKNTTQEGGVKMQARQSGFMDREEIQAVQNIGRKSIASLTSNELAKLEKFAKPYWESMGVKSPFFRAWFGDWRLNDTKTRVEVVRKKGSEKGSYSNKDTGWDIQVSGQVFSETTNHTDSPNVAARKYLPYIRGIVENAVLLDSYGMDPAKPKSGNSLLMHSLYAVAHVGGSYEVLKLYVEEMNDPNSSDTGKRSYQLQNIEKYRPAARGSQKVSPISAASTGTKITVSDLAQYVKTKDVEYAPSYPSKIVNADGSPKVMYHGSQAQFSSFDRKKARSSGTYGKGFYFTDSTSHAGTYGNLYEVYLSIKNPVEHGKGTVTKDQVRKFLEAVAENEDYSIENYGTYDIDKILKGVMGGLSKADTFRVIQDISVTAIGDMVEAVELFNEVNGTNYDGIVAATETVAFQPTQIKSATDNVGTFDKGNTNIYYSDRDAGAEKVAQELEKQKKALNADAESLAELIRLRGDIDRKESTIYSAARYLSAYHGVIGSKKDPALNKELAKLLKEFFSYLDTEKDLSWEQIEEKAKPVTEWIFDHTKAGRQRSEYARDVLAEIRNEPICMSIQKAESKHAVRGIPADGMFYHLAVVFFSAAGFLTAAFSALGAEAFLVLEAAGFGRAGSFFSFSTTAVRAGR